MKRMLSVLAVVFDLAVIAALLYLLVRLCYLVYFFGATLHEDILRLTLLVREMVVT